MSPTFPQERHCENCDRNDICWTNISEADFLASPSPANFQLRAQSTERGWNAERFLDYMKAVYGQICRNFSQRTVVPDPHFANLSRDDIQSTVYGTDGRPPGSESEWDSEDN